MGAVTVRSVDRAKVHPSTVTAAMAAFEMNPGHSDLYDEQPIGVQVSPGEFVTVLLGEIRETQRQAYALRNAQAALREIAGLLAAAPFEDGSHVVSGADVTTWTLRHAAALSHALRAVAVPGEAA